MFVTYQPEGEPAQEWEFDPQKVRASQAEMVEKRFGQPWSVFLMELMKGAMLARRVLLWHLIRRTHNALRFEDTPDFYSGEVKVEFTRGELEAMRAEAEKAKGITDDERALMLSTLDAEIATAHVGVEEGKALSPSDGDATG